MNIYQVIGTHKFSSTIIRDKSIVFTHIGPTYGVIAEDEIAVTQSLGIGPFYGISKTHLVDIIANPVLGLTLVDESTIVESFDDEGNPINSKGVIINQ